MPEQRVTSENKTKQNETKRPFSTSTAPYVWPQKHQDFLKISHIAQSTMLMALLATMATQVRAEKSSRKAREEVQGGEEVEVSYGWSEKGSLKR